MTKSPSWKLSEVFILIIPQVIRIHWNSGEWEVVVVCCPRRGMKIFVLMINIPKVIRIHFSEWEVVVTWICRPRRELKLYKDIDVLETWNHGVILVARNTMIPNLPRAGLQFTSYQYGTRRIGCGPLVRFSDFVTSCDIQSIFGARLTHSFFAVSWLVTFWLSKNFRH